jgi:hypothetical protein
LRAILIFGNSVERETNKVPTLGNKSKFVHCILAIQHELTQLTSPSGREVGEIQTHPLLSQHPEDFKKLKLQPECLKEPRFS